MKSRFLASTTVVLTLLLGLVAPNLMAQITDASSVDFEIANYVGTTMGAWRTSTDAGQDTVGRKTGWRVTWQSGNQASGLTKYTITFPAGTVLNSDTLKNSGVQIKYTEAQGSGTITNIIPAENIEVVAANTLTSYNASTRPAVRITSNRNISTYTKFELEFLNGVWNGKSVISANSAASSADWASDDQQNLNITFQNSDDANVSYSDYQSFYLRNDLADGVVYNTAITSIISGEYLPGGDSLIVVDRFGNYVPDFLNNAVDSMLITVSSATTVGKFTSRQVDWIMDGVAAGFFAVTETNIDTLGAGNMFRLQGSGAANFFKTGVTSFTAMDSANAAYGPYQQIDVNGGTSADNNDKIVVPIYIGNTSTRTAATYPYTMGLKFTKGTSSPLVDGDTVTITVYVGSQPASSRNGSGTYLGETADHITVIKRVLQPSTASKKIGSLTMAFTAGTSYNGLALGSGSLFTMTLKNVFGDNFAGTVGTDCDSVNFIFKYRRSGVVNDAMTTILQNGAQVTSLYSRPKSRLVGTNFHDVSTAPYGSLLYGQAVAAGVVTLTGTKYFGTTSHPQNDSIYVVAYAKNSPNIRDSVLIHVEPSPPIAFDLDSLSVNLTAANNALQVVKGAAIARELPIFALDTAYNRVSNLDLKAATAGNFLGSIAVGYPAAKPAINLLVDGLDPLGYKGTGGTGSDTTDAIRVDSLLIASVNRNTILSGNALYDSTFIYGYNFTRADSSRLNFGGTGLAKMGMRLQNTGWKRVTIQWQPGTMGAAYGAFNTRTLDLGLFNVQSASLIDSVTSVAAPAVGTDSAGQVSQRIVSFTTGIGEAIGPDRADSLMFVKFINLPAGAGIPAASINKDSVKVSVDNVTYYSALDVKGGSEADDSIAVLSNLLIPATTATTIYIRIGGFVNPTQSDTTYGVKVATEASPIWATKANALTVNDGGFAKMKIVARDSITTDVTAKNISTITALGSYATAVANSPFYVKTVLADKYGNILNTAATATKTFIAKSVDSTATGGSLAIQQIWGGSAQGSYTNSKGINDTLTVKTDSINGTAKFVVVDSIKVTPARAGSYYLVLTDKDYVTATDSILLTVKGTVSGSMALVSPLGKQTVSKGATVDSALTVKLYDVLGNALADSVVTFAVIFGNGTFVDSNGVAVAVPNDTIWVKTNALGQASVKIKAATTGDSIAVAAYNTNSSVTRKYFTMNTTVSNLGMTEITFLTVPDSLTPDTAAAKSVVVKVTDLDGVKKVKLLVSTFTLTLGTDNKFTKSATSVDTTMWDSTMKTTKPAVDTVTFSIPKKALGSLVEYTVTGYDANDSSGVSATKSFIVGAKRGKSKLTTDAVNVADIMRLVYLVLGYATPTAIDYFGLDLNQDGAFTDADLVKILEIWKGTSTLASSTEQQKVSAKASLSFKEIDKANVNLLIDLENRGALNYASFQVKYDATKYSFGEVSRTERIDQNVQVVFNNRKSEGILHIIVINLQGRSIASGSGAILSVPVQALNGKFDGTGEISLLSAGFEQNVQSELSKEVLSPKASLPKAFALGQNYPNPFNPSTTVAYDIPEGKEVQVRLNIYNVRGQLVRTLVDEVKSEGSYQIQWDGSSNNGQKVSSGVYFYRLIAGDFNQTRKMVILK